MMRRALCLAVPGRLMRLLAVAIAVTSVIPPVATAPHLKQTQQTDRSAAPADPGLVELMGLGAVRGVVYSGAYRAFFGVPYAEPSTPATRWRPPLPVKPWAPAELMAYTPAPACAASAAGVSATNGAESEELCLHLNVWAPLPEPAAPAPTNPDGTAIYLDAGPSAAGGNGTALAPVIVFLHGGGFENGGTTGVPFQWGDTELGVFGLAPGVRPVVVSVAFRLNIFGFLGGDELRDRTDSGDGSTGNWGIKDQRLALRFIQQHISAFGGDPASVMLMGNSAGASCVAQHLVTPASRGLFQRAGLDSGAFMPWGSTPRSHAQMVFDAVATHFNCTASAASARVACLRRVSTRALVRFAEGSGLPFPDTWQVSQWAPVVDGVELAAAPTALLAAGHAANVPVLIGSNLDDGTEFVAADSTMNTPLPFDIDRAGFQSWAGASFPGQAEKLAELYGTVGDTRGWWWAASRVLGDFVMTCPQRRAARLLAARPAATAPVYRYFFSHVPEDPRLSGAGGRSGACHGCELMFEFGTTGWIIGTAERSLANDMGYRWARFAKTGVPGAGWPRYQNSGQTANVTLELATEAEGGVRGVANNHKAECDWWDSYNSAIA